MADHTWADILCPFCAEEMKRSAIEAKQARKMFGRIDAWDLGRIVDSPPAPPGTPARAVQAMRNLCRSLPGVLVAHEEKKKQRRARLPKEGG